MDIHTKGIPKNESTGRICKQNGFGLGLCVWKSVHWRKARWICQKVRSIFSSTWFPCVTVSNCSQPSSYRKRTKSFPLCCCGIFTVNGRTKSRNQETSQSGISFSSIRMFAVQDGRKANGMRFCRNGTTAKTASNGLSNNHGATEIFS